MELNLLPILNFEGKKMQISQNVEVFPNSDDGFAVSSPFHFEGYALNTGGVIELFGNASGTLEMICDRCAEKFKKDISFEVNEKFRKEDEFSSDGDDSDFIILKGTSVDLSDIVYSNLYMNLPLKNLCSDTCKGICPVCGTNLNFGTCSCDSRPVNPAFDILDNLL